MRKAPFFATLVALAACQRAPSDTLAAADELQLAGRNALAAAMLRRIADAPRPEGDQIGDFVSLSARERLARLESLTLCDYSQALEDWSLVAQHPRASPAHKIEAIRQEADILRSRLARPLEAVRLLREAAFDLGAHPEGAAVRAELVALLSELGDTEGVIDEGRALIERFGATPEAEGARLAVAQAHFVESQLKEALENFTELQKSASSPALAAVALVGAGDCLQEQGEQQGALERYYAALKEHPNPAMVQAKVARVRARLYHLAPQDRILNATRPSRHVAAWQPRPTPADLGFDRVPHKHTVRLAPNRP